MPNIRLHEELHANTRRTRVTYRAEVDGILVALKSYRKPMFGLFHWLRALIRGRRIRRAGGPVPPIVYAGWAGELTCFCFATAFLDGYRSMRETLREAEPDVQSKLIDRLGASIGSLHALGIEQTDGNLTNFLVNADADIALIDEDDVRCHGKSLRASVAKRNLANIASRFPEDVMVEQLFKAYGQECPQCMAGILRSELFEEVEKVRQIVEQKRASRNINPKRYFD